MATVDAPRSHGERLWFVIDLTGTRYAMKSKEDQDSENGQRSVLENEQFQ